MISVITGFINELREAGVPVSMVEAIDGMKAVKTIDLGEKIALRETLRATLIKNLRHERAFDTAFDVYFSNVPGPLEPDDPESAEDLPPSTPGRVLNTSMLLTRVWVSMSITSTTAGNRPLGSTSTPGPGLS
ncbi:MAG: hypothetical protein ACE1Y9_03800, partial [Acidimicrobiia bacterium]